MSKKPTVKDTSAELYLDLVERMKAFPASSIYYAAKEAKVQWADYLFYGTGVRDDAYDCLSAVEEICEMYNFTLTDMVKMLVVANSDPEGKEALHNDNWMKLLPKRFDSIRSKSFAEEDGA